MNYKGKDILTAISLMTFIICFAVVVTVFFKPLYYLDMKLLDISYVGISAKQIKEAYSILIDYQSIFYQKTLVISSFPMSEGGSIHFYEVKRIFEIIQVMMVFTGFTSFFMIIDRCRHKEYRSLKLAGILTIVIPSFIGFVVALNFTKAFLFFHRMLFTNTYWIFDPETDPIIDVLPEAFFMHCFIMIIAIVLLLSMICFFVYHHKEKQILMK